MSITLSYIKSHCRICGECWEWISAAKSEHFKRYPETRKDGKRVQVRREAYALAKGAIPQDIRVAPDCGNPRCINPWHQVPLTESQKCQRAADRGAYSSPARAAKIAKWRRERSTIMDAEKVEKIKASTDTFDVISQTLGVSRSHACRIKRGLAWGDYANPFAGLMR